MTFIQVSHETLLGDATNLVPGVRAIPLDALNDDEHTWEGITASPLDQEAQPIVEFFQGEASITRELGQIALLAGLSRSVEEAKAFAKQAMARHSYSRLIGSLLAPQALGGRGLGAEMHGLKRFLIDFGTEEGSTSAYRLIVAKGDMARLGFSDYDADTPSGQRWYFDSTLGIYVATNSPAYPSAQLVSQVEESYGDRDTATAFIDAEHSVELLPYFSLDFLFNKYVSE